MNYKPTKDAIVRIIKEKKYNFVSSRDIDFVYFPKNRHSGSLDKKDLINLTRHIGRTLPKLEEDGILTKIIGKKDRADRYAINHDKLDDYFILISARNV